MATRRQTTHKKTAIIIGAGIGGLAVANLLAKSGVHVDIYEQHDMPGGRAGTMEIDGFRFDTGPSWYLMPEIFEHYFELLGEDINQHLELLRLDPGYKVNFELGDPLSIHGDEQRDLQTFEQRESGSAEKLKKYLAGAQKTYEIATKYFLYNNFDSLTNVLRPEVLKAGPGMAAVATKTVDQNVARYIADPKLRQVLEYHAVFLGASPFEAPAIYSLMSHLDFKQGVYYPQGGIYTIIESLVSIGKKLGVSYHYSAPVRRIITEDDQAIGIELANGAIHNADIVISNADLHFTETQLLPPERQTYPETYWQKRTAGPSGILMYLGLKGKLPDFEHHNLFFTTAWESSFADIFDKKVWPEAASMYVCVPSKTDPSVAPKESENVFVLVPGPAVETMTEQELETLADKYIDQLVDMSGVADLRDRIVVKRLFGPADFARQFNSWRGTALGLSHTLRQSAMFRPKNKSAKLRNLYYVGANTVPGVGLPMCLIGAELVYKRIIRDKTSGPLAQLTPIPEDA